MQMRLPTVVTVGVAVIATLMLISFYFWIAIWVFGRINPPGNAEFGIVFASDFLTTGRVILATVASGIATAFTWYIGDTIAR